MNYITFVILVGLGSLNIETTPDSHKYEDQKTKKKKMGKNSVTQPHRTNE